MTQAQATFLENLAHELRGVECFSVGAMCGCSDCGLEDCDDMNNPDFDGAGDDEFSWSSCDSCGSNLGGSRHAAHGCIDSNVQHFSVCVDCIMYHANGDLPEGDS